MPNVVLPSLLSHYRIAWGRAMGDLDARCKPRCVTALHLAAEKGHTVVVQVPMSLPSSNHMRSIRIPFSLRRDATTPLHLPLILAPPPHISHEALPASFTAPRFQEGNFLDCIALTAAYVYGIKLRLTLRANWRISCTRI